MAGQKTVISVTKPTPMWATWVFRITFLLTTAVCAWIAATNLIPESAKYELTLLLKVLIDPIVWGLSRMVGVDEDVSKWKQK